MSTSQLRVAGTGLFFLVIFLFGIWLSRSGRPYNAIIFNIHKLVSIAAAVFFVITIFHINRTAKLSAIELIACMVTGLFFLGTIASGGLLSIDKPMSATFLTMHRITSPLTLLSTAATLYLLLRRK